MRLTAVLFQMSQLRAAKRVCKKPGTKAYFLAKSVNNVDRREWLYRDGAARKVLGDRDFVFGDELTRENLLKIVVTADELREVNVYKVCVQPVLVVTAWLSSSGFSIQSGPKSLLHTWTDIYKRPITIHQRQDSSYFHPHGLYPHGGLVPLRSLSRCRAYSAKARERA